METSVFSPQPAEGAGGFADGLVSGSSLRSAGTSHRRVAGLRRRRLWPARPCGSRS